MIIDADCHISSEKLDPGSITADDLIARMDRASVDRAIVWLRPPYDRDIDRENQAVYAASRRFPDRLLPFGWANPRLGRQATFDTIKRCFEEYGFLGIKFNGAQDDYVIDDPDTALPFVEYAASFGKPIAFHIGADSPENTHPARLANIASRYPSINFLMSHMGGSSLPPLSRSAIEASQGHANIFLIGSAIHEVAIDDALRALGASKVCFGSDEPFRFVHVQLAGYLALLRDSSQDERSAVLGGNIARLLGLESRGGQSMV